MFRRRISILALLIAGVALTGAVVSRGVDGESVAARVQAVEGEPSISVSGHGETQIDPDAVLTQIGVDVTADSVSAARSQAAAAMSKVIASLKANGVADRDIQTSQLSIYPIKRRPQAPTRYQVTNVVSATIRNLNTFGKVIDDAVGAAGNAVTVHGIHFIAEDPAAASESAREEAMADARTKAEQLARFGGVTLGPPILIVEGGGGFYPYPVPEVRDPSREPTTPIEPGQLTVTVDVSVTFAIQ